MGKRKKNPLVAPPGLVDSELRRRLDAAAELWLGAALLSAQRCQSPESTPESRTIDLNFFVVAANRIRNIASATAQRLHSAGASEALAAFDRRWPNLQNLRQVEEHILDPNPGPPGSAGISYFGEFTAFLWPSGTVEYLVDVRDTPETLRQLVRGIQDELRTEQAMNVLP
jgi:hypothetical protein